MKTIFTFSLTLITLWASAHPVELGRLHIENDKKDLKVRLEIDDHSCEHIIGKCGRKDLEENKVKLLHGALGESGPKIGGKFCVWQGNPSVAYGKGDTVVVEVTANCELMDGDFVLEAPFLKQASDEYQLMGKFKLNKEERSLSAEKAQPWFKLKLADAK